MKYFKEVKPTKDGDYWYLGPHSDKPIIAQWDNLINCFCGDADHYGPHRFVDPIYWDDITYPGI